MDRHSLLKKLDDTLSEWERSRQRGELWIEVKDGVHTLFKATTQHKLNSHQLGGLPHVGGETR